MLQTVVSVSLPIQERLSIRRQRLSPATDTLTETNELPRLCIVTGTHGDELEGQYVCYALQQRIAAAPEALHGIVDLYPTLNPLGMATMRRSVPVFDLDMNRIFPGTDNGPASEHIAHALMRDLRGASCVVDLHASNIFLREAPQVRLSVPNAEQLLPLARLLNTDFIWVSPNVSALESTLTYSLNAVGTPAMIVEMGIGLRLTPACGEQLTDGLLALMARLGIWSGEVPKIRRPVESADGEVVLLHAEEPGIFIPAVPLGAQLARGQCIGEIVNVLRGEPVQRITAPADGWLFTLREYPSCCAGSLVARMLLGGDIL